MHPTPNPPRDPASMLDLAQPRDRLFKILLSHPKTVDPLLRERLPSVIADRLTDDPPEIVAGPSFCSS